MGAVDTALVKNPELMDEDSQEGLAMTQVS
jgi:hypothetical protein